MVLEVLGPLVLAATWIYILVRVARDIDARGQPGVLWALGMVLLPYVALLFYLWAKRRYPVIENRGLLLG